MRNQLHEFGVSVGIRALSEILLSVGHGSAASVKAVKAPHYVPWAVTVTLKGEHLASRNWSGLTAKK